MNEFMLCVCFHPQ
jgi:hypothetical protein